MIIYELIIHGMVQSLWASPSNHAEGYLMPNTDLLVIEIAKNRQFLCKAMLYQNRLSGIVDSQFCSGGSFCYVISPHDSCPVAVLALIWNDMQSGETFGQWDGYAWKLAPAS